MSASQNKLISLLKRWGPFAIIIIVLVALYQYGIKDYFSYTSLIKHRVDLSAFVSGHYLLAVLFFILIYFVLVAVSFPGVSIFTLASGLLFGGFLGGVYTVIGATFGAIAIFLIARSSFGDILKDRAGPFVSKMMEGFQENAFQYLLVLRLVPIFPFWVVNIAPAFFNMKLPPYTLATVIGIIPGSFVYSHIGAGLDSVIASTLEMQPGCVEANNCSLELKSLVTKEIGLALGGLALLSLFPLVFKFFKNLTRKHDGCLQNDHVKVIKYSYERERFLMSDILKPDICVIGAGSGGLSVAAIAASFGVSVILIERDKMGGDCLNYGCVPSKALLAAGKQAQAIRDAKKFGIQAGEIKINYKQVHKHVHDVIAAIEPNDSVERFTALGVEVIHGEGKFLDEQTVEAGGRHIKARRFVIATGSTAFVPPIKGIDEVPYLTNETIFDSTKKINHLVIIGGGAIGMEMAQAHRRLGSEVTLLEAFKVLPKDDPELTSVLVEQMREEGIHILEGAKVSEILPRGKSGVRINYELDGEAQYINGTHLLMATGRMPSLANLQLEKAGIKYERKGITVKPDLRTTNKRVYAIGDAIGGLQFTHVAGYHAGLVIRGILFRKKAVPNNHIIPWVTYTEPEIAHVGMNEEEARKHHKQIKVLRWPYHENDRAQAELKIIGQIKMIAGKKGDILGVSIVGANAGEMINMWSLALSQKMKLKDVASYISPYPTMSEIGKRAAVTSFAPLARSDKIRWLINLLRKFG